VRVKEGEGPVRIRSTTARDRTLGGWGKSIKTPNYEGKEKGKKKIIEKHFPDEWGNSGGRELSPGAFYPGTESPILKRASKGGGVGR